MSVLNITKENFENEVVKSEEVVLLDLRYLSSNFVGQLAKSGVINFENADVLFMYSTLLLNNSTGMK